MCGLYDDGSDNVRKTKHKNVKSWPNIKKQQNYLRITVILNAIRKIFCLFFLTYEWENVKNILNCGECVWVFMFSEKLVKTIAFCKICFRIVLWNQHPFSLKSGSVKFCIKFAEQHIKIGVTHFFMILTNRWRFIIIIMRLW